MKTTRQHLRSKIERKPPHLSLVPLTDADKLQGLRQHLQDCVRLLRLANADLMLVCRALKQVQGELPADSRAALRSVIGDVRKSVTQLVRFKGIKPKE